LKTLLVFPPVSDPSHPPLGIASLAAYLRQKGENVTLLDLNIPSYWYLLSEENMRRSAERIESRLFELQSREMLLMDDAVEYQLLAENSLSKEYLVLNATKALSSLRDPTTYTARSRYSRVSNVVRRAMEFVSAAHYPVRWYPRGFSMSYLPTKSADVLRAVTDSDQNLFIPFYESYMSQIASLNPDIIGISINYYCQMIPGITLASMLRSRFNHSFIVAGGGLICFFEGRWEALRPFSGILDGMIPYEGEIPLLHLTETLRHGRDLPGGPGLVYFDGPSVVYNPPEPPPDLKKLPAPDFEGLPLEQYLAPKLVLPYLTSRGCYWGRCAFCSHDQLYRGQFRKKSAQQALREMRRLSDCFSASAFYLTDESIPPSIALGLARGITKTGTPYTWFGEFRFETSLDGEMLAELKAGGCVMLIFGLESGERRVLDLMEKGIDPEAVSKVLRGCDRSDIRTFVMFFVGFPTETREEAEKTIQFIEAHRGSITHIAFTNFILEMRSPVYANPTKYAITGIDHYPGEDLKIYAEYSAREGLTAREAISFLDEIKSRPGIRSLIETYLISRMHLTFLPVKEVSIEADRTTEIDFSHPAQIYPRTSDGVVSVSMPFSLEEVRDQLNRAETGSRRTISKRPTNYLFDVQTERLIEVGKDGLLLIKPCNGRYKLSDILSVLNGRNKKVALQFYRRLCAAGFLSCERQP
jgi:anaerobic magnesium-protoporphyrin IX monomethyl ester cyclase